MKRLSLVIIALLVLLGLGYFFLNSGGSLPTQDTKQTGDFKPDPSGATFIFDDGPITFSKGKADKVEGVFAEEIVLTDDVAYGDLNSDNKSDTAVLILRSGGGSGSFIYVAALISSLSSYKGTNALYIGDRIVPQSVSIEDGQITVTYLDRKSDEPMAVEPTVETTKKFVLRSGSLVEIN
jgi:hypothetical protein